MPAAQGSGFSRTSVQQSVVLAALASGSSQKLVLQRLPEPVLRQAVAATEPWSTPAQPEAVQALVRQRLVEAEADDLLAVAAPLAHEQAKAEVFLLDLYVQHLVRADFARVPCLQ